MYNTLEHEKRVNKQSKLTLVILVAAHVYMIAFTILLCTVPKNVHTFAAIRTK